MHYKLTDLCRQAEDAYMHHLGVTAFEINIQKLRQNLEIYEILRDNEVAIFQPIADQLESTFPQTSPQAIERCVIHWLSIMRYLAMAVLLDNPEYLERRILEWLTDQINLGESEEIEFKLYELLLRQLKKQLSDPQLSVLQPFLRQTKTTLFGKRKLIEV